MGNSHRLDDMHLLGIIKDRGLLNIQELCRIVNGRDFKFCHKKHEKYQHIDDRLDNQFVKQCNDCSVHYRDIYDQVRRLEREKKVFTDLRRYFDRKDDNGTLYKKRTDEFRFVFVDKEVYDSKILKNTLDGYR